jgi:hypothetical protein
MKDNFEYWVNNSGRKFLLFYWVQYVFFYFLALGSALKSTNPYAFLIVGFTPYITMLIFRSILNPLKSLENGLKTYDISFYQRLVKGLPEQNRRSAKERAGYFLRAVLTEPEANLNSAILAFKKNYSRTIRHSMVSLVLWFSTFVVLWTYLYFGR